MQELNSPYVHFLARGGRCFKKNKRPTLYQDKKGGHVAPIVPFNKWQNDSLFKTL